MAEEEMSAYPAEETAPAEDRLNAPLLPSEPAAVPLPSYSDTLQPPAPRFLVNPAPEGDRSAQRTGARGSFSASHRQQFRRRKPQGTAKALLLLLGIGQWYSGVCLFISFAFFSGGSVAVVLSTINFEVLVAANIATIVAGVVFVLISIVWPCTWVWDQCSRKTGCSYTPLLCYSWLLSLAYFGVIGALVISVVDHYDCVHFCKDCPQNNSTDVDNLCTYVRVPFWMLVAMLALAVVFILVSCVLCVSMSCKNVRISWGRETQRTVEQ